jgi:phosphoglycolate phosphatase
MNRPIRAILFDLDGTLIHSLPDLVAAVNRMLARHGRDALASDEIKAMVGDGANVLVSKAFAARGGLPGPEVTPYLDEFMADYEPRSAELTRPFPEVVETLDALKARGLALAVCTNKPSRATAEVLAALELEHWFDVVVGSEETPAIKPDPAHVRVILERLGLEPDEALMVGDSINDVLAGKAAGCKTVVVGFGYARTSPHDLGGDVVVERFSELLGLV